MLNIFDNCSGFTSVHILDLEAWCNITFDNYSANPLDYAHHLYLGDEEIKNLVIPNSITSIGNYTFHGCSGLTSVTIGDNITSIGNCTFHGCIGLTSMTIGKSVKSIGEYAFWYCSGLTLVTIPSSVASIGRYAFKNCSGLTSITIPNSVTTIGDYTFFDCGSLTSVISEIENPFNIEASTFSENTFNNATLYIPAGTIDNYKATEGWKKFVFIEEGEPSGVTNVETERAKEIRRYTLNGRIVKGSHKDINIIQMNNGTTKKVIVK